MKWVTRLLLSWVYLTVFLLGLVSALDNPYKILGVDKHATSQEIRRAYKKLAKEV